MEKIALQGEYGSNSHIAVKDQYPNMEPMPCATFDDAFAAVTSGEAQLAMIPIDNTLAGRVADIHHLLPDSGLHIIGEYFLRIEFHVMALKGATFETITDIYSHVHALGQCRSIIRKNNWTSHVAGDTAGAALMVSKQNEITKAALAPRLAADLYDLNILQENVEDSTNNITRFVVLSREPKIPPKEVENTITSFVFRVRNVPAALYKAMGGFATNSVNMTKLESYQINGEFIATQFYAEIDGHPEQDNVALALEELSFFSKKVDILGVYPASDFRNKSA